MRLGKHAGVAPILASAVIVVAILAFAAGSLASPSIFGSPNAIAYKPATETKEFVLFSNTAEFNDSEVGISHDQFSPSTIVVNQGDTVTIHFYNTEDEPEHHNFVLTAYGISVDLAQGEHRDITFTASQAGVFRFYCAYHLPTMTGQLVVLPTG
ncbi:MAG: cupredoxin domain-containing protein [Thaumarchaeota archaeon]|nr:cupredoxin domain-containing protein [Nitrososphaerota archaeon]